jgi:hypothetical protein
MNRKTYVTLFAAALALAGVGRANAGLVINEIKWRGYFEWVELYNNSQTAIDLRDIRLESTDESGEMPTVTWNVQTTVQPYGYYLICDSDPRDRIIAVYNAAEKKSVMMLHDERNRNLVLRQRNAAGAWVEIDRTPSRIPTDSATPWERIDPAQAGVAANNPNWVLSRSGANGSLHARNSYTPYFTVHPVDGVDIPAVWTVTDEMHYTYVFPAGTDSVLVSLQAQNAAGTNITLSTVAQGVGDFTFDFDGGNNGTPLPCTLAFIATDDAHTQLQAFWDQRVLNASAVTVAGKFNAPASRTYKFQTQQGDGCGIVAGGAATGGSIALIGLTLASVAGARLVAGRRKDA